MLRMLAYSLLVVAFAAFAWHGLGGWMRGPSVAENVKAPEDELPLQTGNLVGKALVQFMRAGYPFEPLRAELVRLKLELPPDPAPVSADEERKENTRTLVALNFRMPAGRLAWPKIVAALRERIEPEGVRVLTPSPQPPDTLEIEIPDRDWDNMWIFAHLKNSTRDLVNYVVTCQGIAVGTDTACNKAVIDGRLVGFRRSVLAENSDRRLDAEFRPDLVDANIVAFARSVQAQTDIEVIIDASIWEKGPGLAWRGEPRPVRAALDELCQRERWWWRYSGGRIWLLLP